MGKEHLYELKVIKLSLELEGQTLKALCLSFEKFVFVGSDKTIACTSFIRTNSLLLDYTSSELNTSKFKDPDSLG